MMVCDTVTRGRLPSAGPQTRRPDLFRNKSWPVSAANAGEAAKQSMSADSSVFVDRMRQQGGE